MVLVGITGGLTNRIITNRMVSISAIRICPAAPPCPPRHVVVRVVSAGRPSQPCQRRATPPSAVLRGRGRTAVAAGDIVANGGCGTAEPTPPQTSARLPKRGILWPPQGRPAAFSLPHGGNGARSPVPPPAHQGRRGLLSARATDISPNSPLKFEKISTGDPTSCPRCPAILMW